MKYFITLFILLTTLVIANDRPTGQDLMNMSTDSAMEAIAKMSKSDAEEIISEVRQTAKKDYKKIDNFYFIISHLEEIKAVETEQKRLQSLNLVYILALFLVLFFLVYLFINQRRISKELNRN